jgi:DNA-binding transcriptional ArsR family regulator
VAATRNPARTTQIRPGGTSRGGLVRPGLTTSAPPTVELDARTAYDFLSSACNDCGELDDLLAEDRGWLTENRAALKAEVGGGTAAAACADFVHALAPMVAVRPELKTARQVVAAADELSDADLLGFMLQELAESQDYGEQTRRAIAGDAEAWHELAHQLQANKGHDILPGHISELAPNARKVLRAWLPRYESVEERVGRMIDSDAAAKRREDSTSDPLGFVERATNGVRLVPEPSVHKIVLAPSYFGRPYNSLFKVGAMQLMCYPIADSALGASGRAAPPVATVRLYRALGDESRLRILHLLAERDRYLTELATELELSKPTVSHHLAQLRSAGLVTMTEQGNLTYYSLRRDRIEEAGPELRAFLAR